MKSYADFLEATKGDLENVSNTKFLLDDGAGGKDKVVYKELDLNYNNFDSSDDEMLDESADKFVDQPDKIQHKNDFEHQVDKVHQLNYYRRINKKQKPHLRKYSVGDFVLLKKDFDNNPKPRKETFGPFCECRGTRRPRHETSDETPCLLNKKSLF